jgi:hypothetical protein
MVAGAEKVRAYSKLGIMHVLVAADARSSSL